MSIFDFFSSNSQFTKGVNPCDAATRALLEGIQGNILRPHGRDLASHIFVTFTCDAKTARAWVRERGALVTTAASQYDDSAKRKAAVAQGGTWDGGTFRNLFISAVGYSVLGLSPDHFEGSFRKGMKSRGGGLLAIAKSIVDLGNKDPEPANWQQDYQGDIHVMVMLADDDEKRLATETKDVVASLSGIATTYLEPGIRQTLHPTVNGEKGKDLEHFGYRDGISQPLFFTEDINEKKGTHNDPSAPLELVLARDPLGSGANAFGSYLVFRKLAQDVAGFNQAVVALAGKVNNGDAELTGAQVVGRFKDGTPVTNFATKQGPDGDVNDFNYKDGVDRDEGQRCPVHAHIRKTNPRDNTPLTSHESERSRRIARRGIPYGVKGGTDVGLLFMCFQGDIRHQFEFMQRIWIDDSFFPGILPLTGDDPLIGQDNTHAAQHWTVTYGQKKPTVEVDFRSFVTLRGGEYFFAPSLSFFDHLTQT